MPDVRVAKLTPRLIDKTGRFSSALSGNVRTVARPGERWGFQIDCANLQAQDSARIQSLIAGLRGAANRVLYSPSDYVQRGSFPSGEVLPNNTFSNGVAGYTPINGVTGVADRILRATRNTAGGTELDLSRVVPVTQYAPYAMRAFLNGFLASGSNAGYSLYGGPIVGSSQPLTAPGLATLVTVPISTNDTWFFYQNSANAGIAGDYFELAYTSYARCALVDNGPNLLTQSDTFSTWTLSGLSSVAANSAASPDGTINAAIPNETNANSGHYISQNITVSSAVADYAFTVAVQANAQSWCFLQLAELTGSTAAVVWFNVSTGAIGGNSIGANWSNVRAFVRPLSANWFACSMVARKANAATSIQAAVGGASANNIASYVGSGAGMLRVWRATLAQSSVPSRLSITASVPAVGLVQTGNALNLKGLPATINGLLLAGDWVEINKELKRLTAPLNSDATGLGYLQFSPPLRNPPADNDPVIVNKPLGRFIFSASENGWESNPGIFSNSSLDLVEAL